MSLHLPLAEINDCFRRSFVGGEIYLTHGIASLSPVTQAEIITRVQAFDAFTEDNDPYGDHDFGAFDHPEAGKVFWKIDYYDREKQFCSEDPCDPSKTCRFLTILLAEEW